MRPRARPRSPERATARRTAPRRGAGRRRPSPRTSLIAAALLVAGLVAGYFGWLRDSALVAVRDVTVTGVSSPDRAEIEAALEKAAGSMTTLNVDQKALEASVAAFPTVVSVSADPDLLHGLGIEVSERPPTLVVQSGGQSVPAAGDGTLLRGLELGEDTRDRLPVLELAELPRSGELAGEPLAQAVVAGAAPAPLRPLIEKISFEDETGVEITMKGDIPIRFGDAEEAAAKWAAAAVVLADPKLEILSYIDVRVPDRPAVGGAVAPTAQAPEPVPEAPVEEVVPEAPVDEAVAPDPAVVPVEPAL
jgi:cell division septal protein FtsQ